MYNGVPYTPVGVRIAGNADTIRQAAEAGIRDVVVELPISGDGWGETFALLEELGVRYLVAINSSSPRAPGFVVEPQAYRVDAITDLYDASLPIPGAERALTVVALARDASVRGFDVVESREGTVRYRVQPASGIESVLLIYPEMRAGSVPDFWEGFNGFRDQLLANFIRNRPGPGYRGLVNPAGILPDYAAAASSFVPTSEAFRIELAFHLESKYRSVETLKRSWAVSAPTQTTFEEMARLIPLWNGNRGVLQMFDPVEKRLFAVDSRRSSVWEDIRFINLRAGAERLANLSVSIQAVAPGPVVQEWAGWLPIYDRGQACVDGIGVATANDAISTLIEAAGSAASSLSRWDKNGWFVGTGVRVAAPGSSGISLGVAAQNLADFGAKGGFFVVEPEQFSSVASLASQNPFLARLTDSPLRILGFPVAATNPAATMLLPGNMLWAPVPTLGNRLDFGDEFLGYEVVTDTGREFVIWKTGKPQRILLRTPNAKEATFESIDGAELRPRVQRRGVDLDISGTPIIVRGLGEPPVPEPSLLTAVASLQALIDAAGERNLSMPEERQALSVARGLIDNNPYSALQMLRSTLRRTNLLLGRSTWIEAESSRASSFGEFLEDPSLSNSRAIGVNPVLPPGPNGFRARYEVPVRTTESQTVWVAARIPQGGEGRLLVRINDQTLPVTGFPVSRYGDGFGWYRVGVTRLAGTLVNLEIEALQGSGPVFVDAILMTPYNFTPDGILVPPALPPTTD
jgi:hypothetical protein